MQVTLIFVPPGGGEANYQLKFDLPALPQPGDYISIRRPRETPPGTEDFIVRRTIWSLEYPGTEHFNDPTVGRPTTIFIECEFAIGPWSTEAHRREAGPNAPNCLHRLKVNSDSGEGEHRFRGKVNTESAGR